jgi:hypothetical protein
MKKLHIADTEQVRSGEVTDVYFNRTAEVLRARGRLQGVCMEVCLKSWPDRRFRWGVLAGLEEVCILLEGRPVTVHAMPEGSVFFTGEPVLTIEGDLPRVRGAGDGHTGLPVPGLGHSHTGVKVQGGEQGQVADQLRGETNTPVHSAHGGARGVHRGLRRCGVRRQRGAHGRETWGPCRTPSSC